jgi:alkylation response protein AidB-like acyl-CoA dehydrogenase
MDLVWPDELEDYRRELRAWFDANLPEGPFPRARRKDNIAPLRAWEKVLLDAGLAAVDWPVEHGGAGADPLRASVFFAEYARSGAPRRLNRQAMGLAGPTLMAAGTPAQKDRWLRKMVSCEELWCQGFSEPDAGSDLASLRTRAERDGEHYVVNGQKIWSSNGPVADWTFALVRTDPDAPRHAGITYLMIDLSTPGVEVRPIQQVDGRGDFAEVFYDDVVVPVENRVGEENRGWQVAMTTLGIERGAGVANAAEMDRLVCDVEAIIARLPQPDDALGSDLVRLKAHVRQYRLNAYAAVSSERRATTSTLGVIHKLTWSTLQMQLYELGLRALGPSGELGNSGTPEVVRDWEQRYWLSRASLIYSGTNQIQRNIIGERLLGLPKDVVR